MKHAGEIKKLFDAFIQKLPSPEEMAAAQHESMPRLLDGPFVIREGLFMEGQLAAEYTRLMEEAHRLAEKEGTWSQSAIDDLLAECTLEVLKSETNVRAETSRAQGRRLLEEKPFLAFLLYAVALESAVLGDHSKTEITFQLSARVAHLLGGDLTARENFAAKMKKLYGIRSSVAHSGSREIATGDLEEMRMMCLFSLHALTVSPEFANAKTEDDLESWFRRKLLGG